MKNFWSKFKLFWKELGNTITNFLCPLISLLIAIMELCQLPNSWIQMMKKAEYWAWFASGTKEKIDALIEEIEEEAMDYVDK